MLIKRKVLVLAWIFSINSKNVFQFDRKSSHNRIFVLLNQLLSFWWLHLHWSTLFNRSVLLLQLRKHIHAFVERLNVWISIHTNNNIVVRVFLEQYRHNSLDLLHIYLVFGLLWIQMSWNQEQIVQKHIRTMAVPVEQFQLFRCQSTKFLLFILVLVIESFPFGKNQCIFIRTDRDKVFVWKLSQIIYQKLIRLLYKDDISHALVHSLLKLLQFSLFVEKRLLEKRPILVPILFNIQINRLIDVQYFVDVKEKSVKS